MDACGRWRNEMAEVIASLKTGERTHRDDRQYQGFDEDETPGEGPHFKAEQGCGNSANGGSNNYRKVRIESAK
jgi:hypothetical protein